jgi:hypothetical protein
MAEICWHLDFFTMCSGTGYQQLTEGVQMSEHEEKLRELGAKLGLLYDRQAAMVWLFSPQPLLDGWTPAELIQTRRAHEVIRLLDQILEGAYI